MKTPLIAERFTSELLAFRSEPERIKLQRYFKPRPGDPDTGDVFAGIRMGQVFDLAKTFIDLPPAEIDRLLDSPIHEVRAGALSIMDKQARRKSTSESRRKELFDLYLRRSDRINNWDLVDLAAPHVVGGYLAAKPRGILYDLARSADTWQRRTAIVATFFFIRQGDLDDTFQLGEILIHDPHELVQKAAGGWLREAGKRDPTRLLALLDRHAATMSRIALRDAVEHLDKPRREHYMNLKRS